MSLQVEELSQQVEMLLKVKARLEAEVASVRREQKREVADREDELEDTRNSAAKKVKLLELQLEQEHEERLGFLRERHEMEGRIMSLKDALEHGHNEDQVRKLRKDLRKSKALLKDAQLLLDRQGSDGVNKLVLRQLKNQLEDSEFARTAALKARQNCELELQETQTQLEDVCRWVISILWDSDQNPFQGQSRAGGENGEGGERAGGPGLAAEGE